MDVWRPKKLNYEKNYYDYINYVKTLNRYKNDNKYYELHHILPKSIYPSLAKDKNNLVLLTAREHFFSALSTYENI